jgi:beta-lactamase superfamily II metal-dependent hydrolase
MHPTFTKLFALSLTLAATTALRAAGTFDIYWSDMEGGAGTLLVTPAGESILIDTGTPSRPGTTNNSADRIHNAALVAGITKIDHLVLTHYHGDHFGGAADLAKLMPIGEVLDNGIPDHDPDGATNSAGFLRNIQPYADFKTDRRSVITPGQYVTLKQTDGTPPLTMYFVGCRKQFPTPPYLPPNTPTNPFCATPVEARPVDTTDNINSVVTLFRFGPFKLFIGGDLTWNMEAQMMTPINPVGTVDVYQVDHHGLDLSNNPLLVRSLQPTVSVMSNGPHKGANPETVATLRSVPSIQTMWQIHMNLQGGAKYNTDQEYIANIPEKCQANYIKCSVQPDGKSYTVSIPATGVSKTYATVLDRPY